MTLAPGQLISDRYRLTGRIAEGGMGEVWRATDTVLDRDIAVKVLKSEYESDPEFSSRFRDEAKHTAKISHPGVAAVYDYGQLVDDSGGESEAAARSYLVMELVDGEPLSAILARQGSLPPAETLDLIEQTGRALQAAHGIGLVHRDVKPGNILVTPQGQVKLTDFGIAKAMGAAPVTQTGMIVGTAQYLSPEQALGDESTPAGDVYSLAVVGYECLAGRRPFVADSPVTIAMMHVRDDAPPIGDHVPDEVAELLAYGMAKRPDQRYPDGASFAQAAAEVRSGHRPPPPEGQGGPFVPPVPMAGGQGPGGGSPPTRAMTRFGPGGGRPAELPPTRAQQPGPPTARGPVPLGGGSQPPRKRAAAPPAERPRPRKSSRGGGALVPLLVFLAFALLVALIGVFLAQQGTFERDTGPTTPPTTPTTTVIVPPTEEPSPQPTTPTQRQTTPTTPSPEPTTPEQQPTDPPTISIPPELDVVIPDFPFNAQDGGGDGGGNAGGGNAGGGDGGDGA